MGSISDSLAITIAFSAVPPIPSTALFTQELKSSKQKKVRAL